jgi:hypothetical protein
MLRADPLNRRRIAIGNWAIGAHKNEHNHFAGRRKEWIDRISRQIDGIGLRADRMNKERKEARRDNRQDGEEPTENSEGAAAGGHKCPNPSGLANLTAVTRACLFCDRRLFDE